jgi:transposase
LPALVNAHDVKGPRRAEDGQGGRGVAGQTDRAGHAVPSFVSPGEIRNLRDYTRLRTNPTRERNRYWQRLEKLPEDED